MFDAPPPLTGLSRIGASDAEIIEAIEHVAGPLPQVALSYEADIKTVWLTIRPEPKPVFTLPLLVSVGKVQRAIWSLWGASAQSANAPVRFLAFRGEGPVFTLGGDLDFYLDCLAKNDRAALEEYARVSVEGAMWNASGLRNTVITVATIHAKAIGGGIDAPRSCNVMVAEKRASFVYPEVKFNHFPITAVPVLARRVGPREVEAILMHGDEFSATDFHRLGALEAVVADGTGEQWIRQYCAETLPMFGARRALFASLHQRNHRYEEELKFGAKLWVDCMLGMSPSEISKLQRISQMQERMLSRMYPA